MAPAAGNPQGANAPNIPTAAQLAQLATLQATQTTTKAALDAIQGTHGTLHAAKIAYQAATAKVVQYEAFIAGGQKPGIIDEGGPSVT